MLKNEYFRKNLLDKKYSSAASKATESNVATSSFSPSSKIWIKVAAKKHMQMISAEKLDLIRKFENWKFRIVEIDEKCTFTWNLAQLLIKCQRIAQIIATRKLEENSIMKKIKWVKLLKIIKIELNSFVKRFRSQIRCERKQYVSISPNHDRNARFPESTHELANPLCKGSKRVCLLMP